MEIARRTRLRGGSLTLRLSEIEREREWDHSRNKTERNGGGMEWHGTRSVRIELPNRTRLLLARRELDRGLRGSFADLRPRLLGRDGAVVVGRRKLDITYVQVRPSGFLSRRFARFAYRGRGGMWDLRGHSSLGLCREERLGSFGFGLSRCPRQT